LRLESNGRCTKHNLQDIPGMKAALNALGIPENEQQAAFATALSQMGLKNNQNIESDISGMKARLNALNVPENQHAMTIAVLSQMRLATGHDMVQLVDCKEIIGYLAHHTKGTDDPDKRRTAALRAFNGRQDVGLLQTWESTLATSGIMNFPLLNQSAFGPVLLDMQVSSRPDLQSAVAKNIAFVAQRAADSRFELNQLMQVNQHLLNEIGPLFQRRFTHQFDLNIALSSGSSDGMSSHGGATLYEKTPAYDPSQWKRIDNADAYQEAMVRLVKDASKIAMAHGNHISGDPETMQEELRLMTDRLVADIQDKTFIEHAVLQANPEAANKPFDDTNQYTFTPWKNAFGGGLAWPVLNNYGSNAAYYKNVPPMALGPIVGSRPPIVDTPPEIEVTPLQKADDVMALVNFICGGFAYMAPMLQAKAQKSPDGFRIPLSQGPHVFTLAPMAMKEVWSDNPMASEEWVNANLKEPANKWLNAPKTSTSLSNILKAVGAAIGATPEQIQAIHHDILETRKKSGGSKLNFEEPLYTLRDIHEKLSEHCRSQENGDELLAKLQTAMSTGLIPARIIGDTNWVSPVGRPLCMGVLYNPFTDKLEVKKMHQDGTNRMPFDDFQKWFGPNAKSILYTPLYDRKKF
jgi:hypothetical protein